MHRRHDSILRICDQHRKSVRHLDGEGNALLGGYERIAAGLWIPFVSRAVYDMKLGSVKLGHGRQMGIRSIHIGLSHSEESAVAFVILES